MGLVWKEEPIFVTVFLLPSISFSLSLSLSLSFSRCVFLVPLSQGRAAARTSPHKPTSGAPVQMKMSCTFRARAKAGRDGNRIFISILQSKQGKMMQFCRVYLSLCVVCCVVVPGWGCGGQWELHSHFRLTCMPANRASCPRAAGAYARAAGLKQVAGSERGGHGTHR